MLIACSVTNRLKEAWTGGAAMVSLGHAVVGQVDADRKETRMLIAIDFDDCLTLDAALWRDFIDAARAGDHECICVTARRYTDENIEIVDTWMRTHGISLPVYFTSLWSKVDYMERIGRKVDVWIDDNPRACALGH